MEPIARQSELLAQPHCWLTNKTNAPAPINRATRIPTTSEITQCRRALTSFDLAPFCAAPRPNQKRRFPIAPRRLASAWLARNASQSSSQAYLGREWPRGHQATPFHSFGYAAPMATHSITIVGDPREVSLASKGTRCPSGCSFVLDCANDRREYGPSSTSGDHL